MGPLQQGRLANDRGPAQIARLEDHTRDGSLPIPLEAKDPDIDQPGKVQDTLVCVTMTNMQLHPECPKITIVSVVRKAAKKTLF